MAETDSSPAAGAKPAGGKAGVSSGLIAAPVTGAATVTGRLRPDSAQVSAARALVVVRRRTGRPIPDAVLELAGTGWE